MTYIITGVSRGLGEAISAKLLKRGEKVIGIGRSHNFNDSNFSFIECDLSDPGQRERLRFNDLEGPVTLINNAGILGTIGRMSEQKDLEVLTDVLEVNTIAPFVLLHKVYNQCDKNRFTLVNISSGAANHSIPSWASYCASKAALNMLSETFYLEEKELGRTLKVYAVAPGVIDTGMQKQIRSANEEDFSSVQRFVDLKQNNELYSPGEAADRLLLLLSQNYEGEVFYDLRELNR